MTFKELVVTQRNRELARFDFLLEALYYCNHSQKSARLRRRITAQAEVVEAYNGMIERQTKEVDA